MQNVAVKLHSSAEGLLEAVRSYIFRDEIASNIVLAHALDLSGGPQDTTAEELTSLTEASGDRNGLKCSTARWLTLWNANDADDSEAKLMLVISCLDWCCGSYPVFLWSPLTEDEASARTLSKSLPHLCEALLNAVGRERVFAIFGRADLVRDLADAWSKQAKAPIIREPIYIAYLSWCSQSTLRTSSKSIQEGHRIRLASSIDTNAIATLCRGFAEESIGYKLTAPKAQEEASSLVSRRRIWLYETEEQVVSICAAARQSESVAAITKVYTAPAHRQNGYAELLVREVVKTLLSKKSHVVLYVGVDNQARSVYDRVGFVGLSKNDTTVKLEDALELGFEGMSLGQW